MNITEPQGLRAVIDGDGHLMEDANLWIDYIASGYRDAAPRLVADGDGARLMMDGRLFPIKSGPGAGRPQGLRYHSWQGRVYDHLSEDPRVRDQRPELRLADMDGMGIDVALLYPSVGLHVTVGTEDAGFALACSRAYNDWLHNFCTADQRRLIGIAMIPMQDVDHACRELDRAVSELGFRGAFIRPNPVCGRGLDDAYFDPLWREAVSLGVPINTHEGTGTPTVPSAGVEQFDNFFFTHSVSHSLQTMLAFAQVVAGGVMAKHPALRMAFLESGCGWLPFWLDRLDEHYEMHPEWVPWLERKPSEYFREQGYIGVEAEETMLPYVVERFGSHKLLFASDYPHWDASDDPVNEFFENWRDTLSAEDQQNILCDTAASLYGLDVSWISKVERA
jgi:predicted TIM-barrel fold metal-dependent hydrolase